MNLAQVKNITESSKKSKEKSPLESSLDYVAHLCDTYNLFFSYENDLQFNIKLTKTYKFILKQIDHDYSLIRKIIKNYISISRVVKSFDDSHKLMFVDLFFVKSHLHFFIEAAEISERRKEGEDWLYLKRRLEERESSYYEEIKKLQGVAEGTGRNLSE